MKFELGTSRSSVQLFNHWASMTASIVYLYSNIINATTILEQITELCLVCVSQTNTFGSFEYITKHTTVLKMCLDDNYTDHEWTD